MMATELVTAVQEGLKVIVVLVQNHGFASIGVALGVARARSGSAPATATAPRAAGSTATSCPSTSPPTPPASASHVVRADDRGRAGRGHPRRQGVDDQHGDPRRDRPARRRPRLGVVVGRAGQRDLHARLHPGRARDVRRRTRPPSAPSSTRPTADHRKENPVTTAPRIHIGSAPDSWGVWFADDPRADPGRPVPRRGRGRRATTGSSSAPTATSRPTPPSCRTSSTSTSCGSRPAPSSRRCTGPTRGTRCGSRSPTSPP